MIGNVDFDKLHPKVRQTYELLAYRLEEQFKNGLSEYWLRPYEGYRSPGRQDELFKKGTTKAEAFQSAHNYGLAVDFVPYDVKANKYWWPNADHQIWKDLRVAATNRGLVNNIDWDRPHVQHPMWYSIKGVVGK